MMGCRQAGRGKQEGANRKGQARQQGRGGAQDGVQLGPVLSSTKAGAGLYVQLGSHGSAALPSWSWLWGTPQISGCTVHSATFAGIAAAFMLAPLPMQAPAPQAAGRACRARHAPAGPASHTSLQQRGAQVEHGAGAISSQGRVCRLGVAMSGRQGCDDEISAVAALALQAPEPLVHSQSQLAASCWTKCS